ncbi:hypothetical protein BCR36DRAFT_316907 [Piromyces finnis]|uniref:Uncharacterized protein n=1 Tax=Piromyces finnis TaxID=1754191 RepID=A0A1Y1VLQ6_9FUNG|nr:hypothetical protein BCR36DRAFT_316907 [Piromyces finnis]|eukprot:ORX59085.1 hypothetical protein BCR36DRAFT_316907 [Piromyces finnis]
MLSIILQIIDMKNDLPKRFKNENINVLFHVFYNVLPPLALIVAVVFWLLISPKIKWARYDNLNIQRHLIQHLFQIIFILIDWYLINVPTSLNHAYPMVGIGMIYIVFVHIYHALYGKWIYKFLSRRNKYWFVIYIFVITFWIVLGVVFTKFQMKKYENRIKDVKKK